MAKNDRDGYFVQRRILVACCQRKALNITPDRCEAASANDGKSVGEFCSKLAIYLRAGPGVSVHSVICAMRLVVSSGREVDLLEPVTATQVAHILNGVVIAIDETTGKAGRADSAHVLHAAVGA
ncbi:MAG: hypothetical protein OXQ29_14520 [Rhodospirillaceae bacterium]|nr:hypothetical protein [Rhodospirillaceae bacterium]